MKLKPFLVQIQGAAVALAIMSQITISCTPQKKATKDIPKSYSTVAKGMTNIEARNIYIDRYRAIAIREMERTGIPASIKLAQGILESDAGRSTLSSQYNNHFGIKCHSDWQGERYYKEDDDKDPVTGQLIKSCFRAYSNGDESFIAHSEFLRDPRKVNRYGSLFQLNPKDYVSWANGLESSGYATSSDYSEKLVRLIEDLQLHQYDLMSSSDVASNTNNTTPNGGPINNSNNSGNNTGWANNGSNSSSGASIVDGERNNVKFLKINGGLTLEQVAGRYDISLKKIQTFNEEIGAADRRLPEGTIIYTQQKRNNWSGNEKFYRVQQCETMFDISQKFGIKLSKLYSKNEMRDGDQPAVGEKIVLRRGWFQSVDMPALRDTFGEWKKCRQPEVLLDKPVTNPATATTKPSNNGEFGFEITPGGNTQPANNNTTGQPTLPQTSYPNAYPTYPSTETSSYPSTQPTYPNTQPTYPTNTQPSTTYPSYPSTQPTKPPVTKPTTKPTTTPSQPAVGSEYYTVLQGETLWGISRKFNLTVDKLKQLNNLTDNIIKPGQQLRVK